MLVRRHASLVPLRDSWLISGQGVASCDGRLAALAEDKGVLPCQLTGVVTALSSLTVHHSPSGPARKKAKWDIQLSTGGSSRDAIDVDGETEPPNSKRLYGASSARAAWRQFNGERGPALRTRWIGSFVFRLRHGREQVFEITNSSYDEGSKAKLRVDRIVFRVRNCAKDGGYEEWSSRQTLAGLGEYEDALLSQQLAGKPVGDFGAATAAKAANLAMQGSGPREIIKVVSKEELMEYLESKAVRMNETKDFTLLGFCKGGLDEGPYCRKFLELLEAGGKDAQWLVNLRATSLVISEAKKVIKVRGKDSDPTPIQAAHLIWLSRQAKDLTPLNPTYRETGMTHDHRDDVVTKAVVGASGGLEGEQVEKDRRKSKNIDSYGFTCINIRRLSEMMTVVHGRAFSRNFFMDFDNLLDEVKTKCDGHGEVMLAVDEVTKLVWAELPEKVKSSIDGAVRAGTSAGEAICQHLDLIPTNWATTGKAELLLDTVLTQLRAAGRTQQQQRQQQQERKRGAGELSFTPSKRGRGGGRGSPGRGGRGKKGGRGQVSFNLTGLGAGAAADNAQVNLSSDVDPGWDRFDPAVKEWCEQKGYGSVYSAKEAWLKENKDKKSCFFANSELGGIMGGCFKGAKCFFHKSHPPD